jgi:histidinol-phosphatase (PHP family)
MLDCHIHIERGDYMCEWIDRFVQIAKEKELEEIWLLEHCYRFREFVPMYEDVCAYSDYIDKWFHKKAGVLNLADYLHLIEMVRSQEYGVNIKFGLEVCYFKEFEEFVYRNTKDCGLDFLVGSVHFIDNFAFDHQVEHWDGVDVNNAYRRYFETSIDLANSGIYNGIAHPDCIKLFGHKPSFSLIGYYSRLASALAMNNMYAEQSSGAYRRSHESAECGMDIDLINTLKSQNVKIHTASDAHCPQDVGLHFAKLKRILED